MQLDVRLPMGLLFLVLGIILCVYGFTSGAEVYAQHSLGKNVNLQWGVVFSLFGAVCLWMARKKA